MSDPKQSLIPNVVNPNLWPEPKNIKLSDLQKFVGVDQIKINQSYKNYRMSALYIGGTLFGFLITKMYTDNLVKDHIFGSNGNGGSILNMYTKNTIADYSYNRQFQRVRWLCEEAVGDDPSLNVKESQLVDLGVKVEHKGANKGVRKLIPHDKYLL